MVATSEWSFYHAEVDTKAWAIKNIILEEE